MNINDDLDAASLMLTDYAYTSHREQPVIAAVRKYRRVILLNKPDYSNGFDTAHAVLQPVFK